ncbi:hypothetical protein BG015_009102 [Linnemannia schmuckeri]|uniref:Triosephosphate isomerase n=1 Tax=Linnemannia schmuckeri TaxID=64567 RepID=A0A9P5S685_9FUNG|nr:hypothetical protein BG015_009102 [Linnemannia schmuckeri]
MARRKFIVGTNFKMNGSRAFLQDLVENLNRADLDSNVGNEEVHPIFISPPSLYIEHVRQNLRKDIAVGGQNCFWKSSGAFTGEISAEMLKDVGADYVILGHTERRTLFKESDTDIGLKVVHALQTGLKVIACIGETLSERESNTTLQVLFRQLQAIIDHVQNLDLNQEEKWKDLVIAYEPVWAIGTGRVAAPEQAQEVHAAIRRRVGEICGLEVAETVRIIYGGSVNLGNALQLARERDVDGLFVGGASLRPEFVQIYMGAGRGEGYRTWYLLFKDILRNLDIPSSTASMFNLPVPRPHSAEGFVSQVGP